MDNIKLVAGWLKLALEDWKAVKALNCKEHRGACVYHAQQFVEKICKAVIAALGFEPPKSHNPSVEIDSIITDLKIGSLEIKLDKKQLNVLERISSLSKTLEDERTRPRYGIRHFDTIIPPDEYYSVDQVNMLIEDAAHIANLVWVFLSELGYCEEIEELCGELYAIGKK
ncbi:MAG: HEPN domain-containing protein [Candidatus Njordarchaeia archaeon]